MAIALPRQPSRLRSRSLLWRFGLALAAVLALLGMVALSGGLHLPDQPSAIGAQDVPSEAAPLDGRGKWTGYTR